MEPLATISSAPTNAFAPKATRAKIASSTSTTANQILAKTMANATI